MLPWWRELKKISSRKDYQEFAQKVHSSFEMPKVHNWAKRVDNDHTPLLAHPLIGKFHFLPPRDMRFGTQDYQLTNHIIPSPT